MPTFPWVRTAPCVRTAALTGALALVAVAATVPGTAPEPGSTLDGTPVSLAAAAADPALTAALDQLLSSPQLDRGTTGLDVRDASTGAPVYTFNVDRRVIPASNMKLLSSAAALEVLGAGHRFSTTVLAGGSRSGGVLTGDLILRGTGDPTMLAADYDKLAADVAASGISVVTGRLVADDSWFDDVPLGKDWSWEDEFAAFSAQTSALTVAPSADYDAGAVAVETRPGTAAGAKGVVTLNPESSVLKVTNQLTTVDANGPRSVVVERLHGTNTIKVSGTIPAGSAAGRNLRSVDDPTLYAASVFRGALNRRGVRITGTTNTGVTPAGATQIAARASMTLGEMLVPFLKLSNNMHAEALVKAMGRKAHNDGSWASGVKAMNAALRGLGVDIAAVVAEDGSGLSRRDWVTTQQVANLLVGARTKPWFPAWQAALPVAGNPDRLVGGTLANRMGGTPARDNLRAKTGTMTGVTALSGYVTDRGGRQLVFSAISNNTANVNGLWDQLGALLAASGGPARTARLSPSVPAGPPVARSESGGEVECSWVKAC